MKELDAKTKNSLLDLNINPDHVVFQHIIANKVILTPDILELGLSEEKVQGLINNNILATHPNETLTFHDRHVEVWFKKALEK